MCVGWPGFYGQKKGPELRFWSESTGGILTPALLPAPGDTEPLPIDLLPFVLNDPVTAAPSSNARLFVKVIPASGSSFGSLFMDLHGTYDCNDGGSAIACDVEGAMDVPFYDIFIQIGSGSGSFAFDNLDLSTAVGNLSIMCELITASTDTTSKVTFTKALLHL